MKDAALPSALQSTLDSDGGEMFTGSAPSSQLAFGGLTLAGGGDL